MGTSRVILIEDGTRSSEDRNLWPLLRQVNDNKEINGKFFII